MKNIMKILWIMLISFSMIIHNTTILPTLSKNVQPWMAITTIGIGITMMYFVFHYQSKGIEELKKEVPIGCKK